MMIMARPALLIAGFAIGSAAAPPVRALVFRDATLFQAMSIVHDSSGPDAIFIARNQEVRSFDLASGPQDKVVSALAKQYGQSAVLLNHIVIFTPPIPPANTAHDRVEALKTAIGSADDLHNYFEGVSEAAYDFGRSIPYGTMPFSELSPAQQEQALYLARAGQLQASAIGLMHILEQENTASAPPGK